MEIFETSHTLDELKGEVSTIVKDVDGMKYKEESYLENDIFYSPSGDIQEGSKTQYYLNQAIKRGQLQDIAEHFDPLVFEVKANYKISTGVFSNHNHWIRFIFSDLSRIRMLTQGNELQFGVGQHAFECWNQCCNKEHDRVKSFEKQVNEQLDAIFK